jgi:helix-turn-helix protein
MSYYEKTLVSLSEVKTVASHLSALGKIRNATEDMNCKQLIEALIKELQHLHLKTKSKSMPLSLENATASEVLNLTKYCKAAVGSKKPEWQIMAERNGWIPPK